MTAPGLLEIEYISGQIAGGTQLLLCSDGLTEDVEDAAIAAALLHADDSAQEVVDTLVCAALDSGGSDNITVVLIRRAG